MLCHRFFVTQFGFLGILIIFNFRQTKNPSKQPFKLAPTPYNQGQLTEKNANLRYTCEPKYLAKRVMALIDEDKVRK